MNHLSKKNQNKKVDYKPKAKNIKKLKIYLKKIEDGKL